MNKAVPEHDRLVDEAIDLAIRLQGDPGNPVALEMVRAWRSRGAEHEAAWRRVAKIHGAAGKVLTGRRKAEQHATLGVTRRSAVIGGLCGLAAIGAGSLLLPGVVVAARADYATGTADIRHVELPDGSMATLGPDSAIALDFTSSHRQVDLLAGMSFFDVAEDPLRSFRLTIGEITATALGTAFDVSADAGIVTVAVGHGRVDARALKSASTTTQLAAGDWAAFDTTTGTVQKGRREANQMGAWRNKVIVAEEEPVSALVARIGRWLPGRIVIADPGIAPLRVSGVFDLDNPLRALEAVVHPAGGRVRQFSAYLTVISPI